MELLENLDAALAIKLISTALLVVVATTFAEKFGAFVGAIIAAMPISAGPAYLFIAMEHDAVFIAESSLTSLGVHAMTPVLLMVAAILLRKRWGIVVSLGVAIAVWLAGGFAIMRSELSFEHAMLLHMAVFAITILAAIEMLGEVQREGVKRGRFDVIWRVLAVVGVVGSAVLVGRLVGPKAAGLTALVPVVWISMAIVVYSRSGGQTCAAVLANGVIPMIGFLLAFVAIHLMVLPYGKAVALSAGLAIAVGWNLALTAVRPLLPMYAKAR